MEVIATRLSHWWAQIHGCLQVQIIANAPLWWRWLQQSRFFFMRLVVITCTLCMWCIQVHMPTLWNIWNKINEMYFSCNVRSFSWNSFYSRSYTVIDLESSWKFSMTFISPLINTSMLDSLSVCINIRYHMFHVAHFQWHPNEL